jgi:hypothetical protein
MKGALLGGHADRNSAFLCPLSLANGDVRFVPINGRIGARAVYQLAQMASDKNVASGAIGSVLHSAVRYDLLVWLLTLGREQAFREKILDLARLQAGQSVLDVGLRSQANDMSGPRARCMGSIPRPRCLPGRLRKQERPMSKLFSKMGLL